MEPTAIQTSIGVVYAEAESRIGFDNRGAGRWAVTRAYYSPAPGEHSTIPAALLDELSKLGTEWANAHPDLQSGRSKPRPKSARRDGVCVRGKSRFRNLHRLPECPGTGRHFPQNSFR
jgi:hypothetical protein